MLFAQASTTDTDTTTAAKQALQTIPSSPPPSVDDLERTTSIVGTVIFGLWMTSGALSAYHGFKRNHDSIGWGLGWGLLGLTFPILTPLLAVAEGYALPLEDEGRGRRLFAGQQLYARRA